MLSAVSELCALRDTVARIERGGEGGSIIRRHRHVTLSDEPIALDETLGGGLRTGTLHEITAQAPRDAATAAGFAAAVATRCAGNGDLIWIVDDRAAWETGTPYRQGLAAHGIDPDRLLLVRTRDAATTLWAAEEALRAGAGTVLIELWRGQGYHLAASRRLLMAARRRGGTGLVLHVGLDPAAVSSAADTRFAVAARPGTARRSAGGRTPIPGAPAFAVRLLKRRDGVQGLDRDKVHALAWDRAVRTFTEAEAGMRTDGHHLPGGRNGFAPGTAAFAGRGSDEHRKGGRA